MPDAPVATVAPSSAPVVPMAPASNPSAVSHTPDIPPEIADPYRIDEDIIADLNKRVEGAPKPQPTKPAQTPKPSTTTTPDKPKAEDTTPAKPAEKPTTTDTPPDDSEVVKMAPKALREAYSALKRKHAELQKQHEEFKTKAATPVEDPEKKTLAERLADREKRLADIETELKFTNYERSAEYKEKYYQPVLDAYQNAVSEITQLQVTDAEGNVRQATSADFDRIMAIQNMGEASKAIREMFGDDAPAVHALRNQVRQLNGARLKALEDFKAKGVEREQQMREQSTKAMETERATWNKLNTEAAEKHPQYFKPIEGDDKGNELLAKGFEEADRAFSGKLTPQERVALYSAMRNKAAGFNRLAYRYNQAQKQLADLQAKLDEYEKTVPGNGDGVSTKESKELSPEEQLAAMGSMAPTPV